MNVASDFAELPVRIHTFGRMISHGEVGDAVAATIVVVHTTQK